MPDASAGFLPSGSSCGMIFKRVGVSNLF